MTEPQYSIVFQGELVEGVSHEQARARLMKAYSLEEAKAEALLARTNAVLKRDLSEDKAIRYVIKFRELGLITVIDPPLEARSSAVLAAQLDRESPAVSKQEAGLDHDESGRGVPPGAGLGGGANQTEPAAVSRDE
jgi:hypothetical protein